MSTQEKPPYRPTVRPSDSDCPKRVAVIEALLRRKSETAQMLARHGVIRHGANCPKVAHVCDGYLHDADDDSPYDVDGVMYCGRCHVCL